MTLVEICSPTPHGRSGLRYLTSTVLEDCQKKEGRKCLKTDIFIAAEVTGVSGNYTLKETTSVEQTDMRPRKTDIKICSGRGIEQATW